jgi:hypothetical protein
VGAFTPSPRAAEAVEETVPGTGVGGGAARQPTREATRAAEAPTRAAEAPTRAADEDHVWFEDRWMVASLCDE